MNKGLIHSFESFGAVDGPGIRFIVFLSGCPLRCLYCHNPDTWCKRANFEMYPDEVMKKILAYKNFIKKGGVTISGGEPLMQSKFCEELIDLCKSENIHTAIDTSGIIDLKLSQNAIKKSDLILLDIKDIDKNDSIKLTGKSNINAIKTLDFCESINKPVWIRHVLLPNYTLIDSKLERLATFLKQYKCVQKIELLPYHTLGKFKWDELGLEYKLKDIDPPSNEEVEKARKIFGI